MKSTEYIFNPEYNGETFYSKYVKRLFDFVVSLLVLILTLPFVFLAAIAIKLDSEGPVFFIQERIGKYGRTIKIYKLRTMIMNMYNDKGEKIRDRDRVTRSGKIIRKLSLDEIPQLFNVLKGDMSFIGPRPLLIRYFPYYTDIEVQRHNVLPGITGIAQVKGRGFLAWEERFKYDLIYIKNISLKTDFFVLLETFSAVFNGSGTSTIRPNDLKDFDEHRSFLKQRK